MINVVQLRPPRLVTDHDWTIEERSEMCQIAIDAIKARCL